MAPRVAERRHDGTRCGSRAERRGAILTNDTRAPTTSHGTRGCDSADESRPASHRGRPFFVAHCTGTAGCVREDLPKGIQRLPGKTESDRHDCAQRADLVANHYVFLCFYFE